jgi:hypothetical protein
MGSNLEPIVKGPWYKRYSKYIQGKIKEDFLK